MFLRRNRRWVDGQTYDYWTLVQTIRTAVSGGAKVEENRRIENPVVAARKAGFRNAGFTG